MLMRRANCVLSHEELEDLWKLLAQSVGANNEEERINYETFCSIRDEMAPRRADLFSPSVFLHFPTDDKGMLNKCVRNSDGI